MFILDRGFFTKSNLKRLIDSDYEFIIGASHTFREIKHLKLKAKKDIENANNLLRIEDKIIFYKDEKMALDDKELSLYGYYDIEKKYEKERFYIDLENRIEKSKNRKIWSYENFKEIAREVMGMDITNI